ncbi:MAG: transcriptional regulator [Actinomycetota bacterium]|nr:transcriptional regulator [Actinomycetota bacterium]
MPEEAPVVSPEQRSTYAAVVGARLRAVRRQKRMSLQAVEAASGQEFKASVLGAYERGERAISVPRLQRLARLYDVPVDQLLPEDMAAQANGHLADAGARGARSGAIRINLTALREAPGEQAAALRRFLAAIQVERQDFNGEVLTIRADDLRVIGATFGLGTEEMLTSLDDLGVVQHP